MEHQGATVYVVDDDAEVRRSVAALASSGGMQCRTFASAEEFLGQCQTCDCLEGPPPGCLVIDIQLRGMSGMELQEALLAQGCPLPVIFVSGYADVPTAVRALRNGAVTLLEKPVESDDLIATVRKAVADYRASAALHARRRRITRCLDALDPRETQVLDLIVCGTPNKSISSKMGISQRTVDRLRAAVFEKMGVGSAVELTRLIGEARSVSRDLDGPHADLLSMSKQLSAHDCTSAERSPQ